MRVRRYVGVVIVRGWAKEEIYRLFSDVSSPDKANGFGGWLTGIMKRPLRSTG